MGKKVTPPKNKQTKKKHFFRPTEVIWEDNKKLSVFQTDSVLTDVV